ncbi:MAG: 6,7-dimethyl-8-ribityllumazine synthase [Planctomycetota bacterium]
MTVPTRHEGTLDGTGLRVAIVQGRFNWLIGEKLTQGAIETLTTNGVADDAIDVYIVPGAFELPAMVKRLSDQDRFDVILAIGVVIRGGTPHFEYVCSEAARGVADVAFHSKAAIAFGVLTCDDMQQALDRAGEGAGDSDHGNKGDEAARAALEMANLYRTLDRGN